MVPFSSHISGQVNKYNQKPLTSAESGVCLPPKSGYFEQLKNGALFSFYISMSDKVCHRSVLSNFIEAWRKVYCLSRLTYEPLVWDDGYKVHVMLVGPKEETKLGA